MKNKKLSPFGESIFVTLANIATTTGAVNLGQGFPDWPAPVPVIREAQSSMAGGLNQYPPARGMTELRQAVVEERQSRLGDTYDASTECLVTVGATEALAAARHWAY